MFYLYFCNEDVGTSTSILPHAFYSSYRFNVDLYPNPIMNEKKEHCPIVVFGRCGLRHLAIPLAVYPLAGLVEQGVDQVTPLMAQHKHAFKGLVASLLLAIFCGYSRTTSQRGRTLITLHRPQWPPHRDARSSLPAECLVSRRRSDELLYEGHRFNAADGEYRHVAPSRCTTRFLDRKSLGILYPL